jgi:hypothetical protein
MAQKIIEKRRVPDPSMTDAEYLYQHRREAERAQREGRRPRADLHKIEVESNAITRIGALVFIRRRLDHHERAAERFKSSYEALYGAGNPALDPSRVQVDTSPIAHDAGMAARVDRGRELRAVHDHLGKPAFDRLVALLVLCVPAGEGLHWRPRSEAVTQVLADLNELAMQWGLAPIAAD